MLAIAATVLIVGGIALTGVLAASQDQLAVVLRAYAQSRGVPYSWGGGQNGFVWPQGGPGLRGGIGWDCLGWVKAVIKTFAPDSEAAQVKGTGTDFWRHFGYPKGGMAGAQLGDIVWWVNDSGDLVHVGFLISATHAVSAFGGGSSTNGDKASAKIQEHGISRSATGGLTVLGTARWLGR